MINLRKSKLISLFLAFLLVANSSFALEILTHDAHQHSEIAGMHAGHDMTIAAMGMMEQEGDELAHYEPANHSGEDCICDEICCLNTVDFGTLLLENNPIPDEPGQSVSASNYQSISLDLLLPPPTR